MPEVTYRSEHNLSTTKGLTAEPLEAFLELYEDLGIAVLPAVYGEKRPSVEWRKFQESGPGKEQVKQWFKDGNHNIALLCGPPSGNLVVLDFDDISVYSKFFDKDRTEKETIVVETGGGKIHVYVRSDRPVESFRIPELKLEIRSTGNIVIAPPSKHPNGCFYKFANPEVRSIIIVTDLADSIWRKAEQLGIKRPIDVLSEAAEECREAPYEGRDPPCIAKLLHGVEEGFRNEAAVRIATYWLKLKRDSDKVKTLARLKQWNRLNKPPLPERELVSVVESALKLERSYGCHQNQAWCNPDACVLMRNRLLRAETDEEAEKILSSPDVLEALKPHLDNVLAGEDDNKQLTFILNLSGKVNDPSLKQIILLKGESGAGKTRLMVIADAFKVKDVGRFSAHALDYVDLANFEILRLKELGAMDQEFQGVSTIKFLSSDDRGYTVEVTERDAETGRFTTRQYRVPPMTMITSTTRVSLDPQFERRAWTINPDESREQTERIRRWKANLEQEKAKVQLGLLKETNHDHSLRVLKAVANKLTPCEVALIFPDSLTQTLSSSKLRVRGDYDKILALVKLHAFLYQRHLPKAQGSNGRTVLFATPSFALNALKVALRPFVTMTTELEERSIKLIALLTKYSVQRAGDSVDSQLRGKIAVEIGRSDKTVYRYLQNWCDAGYMIKEKASAKGNPASFKLLVDLDVVQEKAAVTLDISNASKIMSSEAAKEIEDWLNSILDKITLTDGWTADKLRQALTLSPVHGTESQSAPSVSPILSEIPSDPKSSSFQPREPTTLLASEMSHTASPVSEIRLADSNPGDAPFSNLGDLGKVPDPPDPFEDRQRALDNLRGKTFPSPDEARAYLARLGLSKWLSSLHREGFFSQAPDGSWRLAK